MTAVLDHIVVSGETRDAGAAHVHAATGAAMGPGGSHTGLGTHNHLCRLGDDVFLETISRDPAAPAPDRALWYGLDAPPDPPRLAAWVLGARDLDATLATAAALGHDMGTPLAVTRGALSWRFALRADGGAAIDGAAPYVMAWDRPQPHPAGAMADTGLTLTSLTVATPRAEDLTALLDAIGFADSRVSLAHSDTFHLTAHLSGPDGRPVVLT